MIRFMVIEREQRRDPVSHYRVGSPAAAFGPGADLLVNSDRHAVSAMQSAQRDERENGAQQYGRIGFRDIDVILHGEDGCGTRTRGHSSEHRVSADHTWQC